MDKFRFGDHARLWHNQFNAFEDREMNVFGSGPYRFDSASSDDRSATNMTPIMGDFAAGVAGNGRAHQSRSQHWSNDRYSKQNGPSTGYPPRKSLIDTFVERNDDYWKSRVTIKIDVAHTDHSHIIGKQGRNTQTVMKDTGCHIHFPDANRNPELEKSNMVSIAGPMQSVDKARRAIRDLAPLVITLEMKDCREDAHSISEDPLLREVAVMFGLNTLVRTNRSSGQPFFVVRGSVHQTKSIREAVMRLQQRFMNPTAASCSLALDILRPQQNSVVGRNAANIHLISQRTGATIHYPREDVGQATTFFIRGTIDSILLARQYIIGCLPMSFIFEIERSEGMPRIDDMQRELGVSVSTRASRNGEALVVTVKGQERQASQIYTVRHRLLGEMSDEPPVIAPDFEFMKDFPGSGYVPSPVLDGGVALERQFTFTVLPYSPVSAPWYSTTEVNFPFPPAGACAAASSENSSIISLATDCETSSHMSITEESERTTPGGYDPVPGEAPLASSLLEAKKKIQAGTHSKAPGAERSQSVDYEQQQILANKAMREKAYGLRVPTDQWSGYGFSRSMPPATTTPDENKIGPWTLVSDSKNKTNAFTTTNYFEGGSIAIGDLTLSDSDDVSSLLTRYHLAKYADIFREQEIDIGAFLTMTDSDLKELGVNTFGARRRLLMLISALKEKLRRGP